MSVFSDGAPPEINCFTGLSTRQARISFGTGPFGLHDSFHESSRPCSRTPAPTLAERGACGKQAAMMYVRCMYSSSKSHAGMRVLFLFPSVLFRLGRSSAMHALHVCNLGKKRATLSSRSSRTHRMFRKSTEVCCHRGGEREPVVCSIRQCFCWC